MEKELAILDEKLEDKPHKYEIAVQLLNELEDKRNELEQRIHSIYVEGKSVVQDDYNKMVGLAAYCYLNDIAYEHIERMKALSEVDPELANTLFDGSLLQDIAEDGEDLIKQSVKC